jgi:hypothetical protein
METFMSNKNEARYQQDMKHHALTISEEGSLRSTT